MEITKYKEDAELLQDLNIIDKQYLINNNYEIIPIDKQEQEMDISSSVRFLKIDKLVYEKDIKIVDKLTSVYSALNSINTTIITKLVSDGTKCNVYIGIKNEGKASSSLKVLKGALEGNFPGTQFSNNNGLDNSEIEDLQELALNNKKELTVVSGIPSFKKDEDDNFFQGIENLIKGMQGKEFVAVFIANPISNQDIENAKLLYENIYTQLSSLKEQTFSLNENESVSYTKGITKSVGQTIGYSNSNSKTKSNSSSKSYSSGKSKTPWIGKKIMNGLVGGTMHNSNSGTTSSFSNSNTETTSSNSSKSKNRSTNSSTSTSKGSSQGIQYTQENKTISNFLEKLDLQFERIQIGESIGLWNVGSYFLSKDSQNSLVAANIYNGIIKGDESRIEKSMVRTFSNKENDFKSIIEYLKVYNLPLISIGNHINYYSNVVNTKELSIQLGLPQKSFTGIDVVEITPFSDNIKQIPEEKAIIVGKLNNHEKDSLIDFPLDLSKLTGHIFITGSTGAGKSNATYTIIDELQKKGINFLVIEPAKGEYKDVFASKYSNTKVYGTNIKHTELLRINPFSFSKEIHVNEHIDRFIEILNASWPMYAAMPAILKDAIEKSYQKKGWDLTNSVNLIKKNSFPTFADLAEILPVLIRESDYSEEIKSNYIGALVTRVNSMATGLLKPIFSSQEIKSSELFDKNVIIDLSLIPSSETTSLLTGIVFMKLQEYRMSKKEGSNTPLKHITILEEAHNLLKKTSSEQSQEGANLQGKSVEMISNAIAEMRTYGEGFIIADQAPGLLDPSAIRNTNTKICLRLPSFDDRELVGKAMHLSDEQINELSKLQTGVAAVYQNDWQEAALCKFKFFDKRSNGFHYIEKKEENINKFIAEQLICERFGKDIDRGKLEVNKVNKVFKKYVIAVLQGEIRESLLSKYLFELLDIENILPIIDVNYSVINRSNKWLQLLEELLMNKYKFVRSNEFTEVQYLVIKHLTRIEDKYLYALNFMDTKLKTKMI